jgi:hypothetical protein
MHLLDREHSYAARQWTDRAGNGVQQQVSFVQPDPKPEGNRVTHRGARVLWSDLEALGVGLGS